jgi:hypothetical protein
LAPKRYKKISPPQHDRKTPATKLTPPPKPVAANINGAYKIAATAKMLLDNEFAARSDGAYVG